MKEINFSFIAGSVLLLALVAGFVFFSSQKNDGKYIYPVDDAYIHMAISKNLAHHGVFGVTKHEFSATSSSVLHTLLLALLFKIFGAHEIIPLLMNLGFAVAILFVLAKIYFHERFTRSRAMLGIVAIIVFTPLHTLVLTGMEHTAQILFCILLVYQAAKIFSVVSEKPVFTKEKSFLYLLILLAVATRFESLFIGGVITLLFLIRKNYITALSSAFFAAVPVVAFGMVSIANGSYFLPNSLLIKGERPDFSIAGIVIYFSKWLERAWNETHIGALLIILLIGLVFWQRNKPSLWNKPAIITIITFVTFIIHLTLAKTGWFFRYEAYLVALSIFSVTFLGQAVAIKPYLNFKNFLPKLGVLFLVLIILYPLLRRGGAPLVYTIPATHNIYGQQYQMATFIKEYYPASSIAANDIGAICFLNDEIRLLDLAGLGSVEMIRYKHLPPEKLIAKLANEKETEIAIFYDSFFKFPDSWRKAGAWTIPDNVVCANATVSFYAVKSEETEKLRKNMLEFAPYLPKGVSSTYTNQ